MRGILAATLFSGIGAPEQAMPSWRWPWHAEIEKFPAAVLAARHPQSKNLGDVSAHDFAERAAAIARPDVLVFGSPCQSFSIAGKRLGLDDPRGNLAVVALGLAGRLRPGWIVFENVPGLLSSDEGRDFGAFLGLLEQLGYGFASRVLDAQFFGVPQRRRRVFVVGHFGDWRRAAAVLFEPESLRRNPAPGGQARQSIAPTIASRPTGGGGLGTDFDCDGGLVAATLEATAQRSRGAGTPAGLLAEVAQSLTANWERSKGATAGNNVGVVNPVIFPSAVRRLTPRECERLQGFPDDYTLITYRGKPAADGPRYKALGNSMAVPVMRWILSRIDLFEREIAPQLEAAE